MTTSTTQVQLASEIAASSPNATPVPGVKLPDTILLHQSKEGEYLEQCGQLFIFCNPFENNNKFMVADHKVTGDRPRSVDPNQTILLLQEDSTSFCRACCASSRTFDMIAYNNGQPQFHMYREHPCLHCRMVDNPMICLMCGPCCWCPEIMEVDSNGTKLGRVEQRITTCCWNDGFKFCNCSTIYEIYNEGDEHISDLDINMCNKKNICHCGMPVFDIVQYPQSDPPVLESRIQNIFMGLKRECCTDVENFRIEFQPQGAPKAVDQKDRPLHIAAAILLKYTYFEKDEDGGE